MIDWLTFQCHCDHSKQLKDGTVIRLDNDGKPDWSCDTWLPVEGSHSSKILIRSVSKTMIEVSGNPAKFLQGHNLFGTNDLCLLLSRFFDKLISLDLGLNPTEGQRMIIDNGLVYIRRIDINETWHLSNKNEVLAFLRALEKKAHLKNRGRGEFSGNTLYFGKKSRRWALKAYSKGDEISAKGHKLPKKLATEQMIEYADKALRIELVMRRMHLKEIQNNFDITKPATLPVLLQGAISDLQMSDNFTLPDDIILLLTNAHRSTYLLWKDGYDIRPLFTKSKFYAHRNALLKHGIDIAIKNSNSSPNNVIPMIKVLEASPVGVPSWAYEKNLVVA